MDTQKLNYWDASSCNALLRLELAAIEVYGLATQLVGGGPENPDYKSLKCRHEDQAAFLTKRITDLGGAPRTDELSWDRPHAAVLSAATIYGANDPLDQLLEQEEEILAAYEKSLRSENDGIGSADGMIVDRLTLAKELRDELASFATRTDFSVSRETANEVYVRLPEVHDAVA